MCIVFDQSTAEVQFHETLHRFISEHFPHFSNNVSFSRRYFHKHQELRNVVALATGRLSSPNLSGLFHPHCSSTHLPYGSSPFWLNQFQRFKKSCAGCIVTIICGVLGLELPKKQLDEIIGDVLFRCKDFYCIFLRMYFITLRTMFQEILTIP